MKRTSSFLALVVFLLTALASAQAAYGHDRNRGHQGKGDDLVFVQTNELEGNRVVVFERGDDGRLEREGTFATGGRGGAAAPGDESDRLASQGSLGGCRASASTATTYTACRARPVHSGSRTQTRRTSSRRPARSASLRTGGS